MGKAPLDQLSLKVPTKKFTSDHFQLSKVLEARTYCNCHEGQLQTQNLNFSKTSSSFLGFSTFPTT